jgi:hypothetical protein
MKLIAVVREPGGELLGAGLAAEGEEDAVAFRSYVPPAFADCWYDAA